MYFVLWRLRPPQYFSNGYRFGHVLGFFNFFASNRESMMRKARGFTLIELMIVVAIIAIIAAITIPQMIRSRLSAEEASAIATLRTLSTAQAQFLSQSLAVDPLTNVSMYATFAQFDELDPPLIDSLISGGDHIKSGFIFSIDLGTQTPEVADFSAYGLVIVTGTNIRNMLTDPSGLIYYTQDGSLPNITAPTL